MNVIECEGTKISISGKLCKVDSMGVDASDRGPDLEFSDGWIGILCKGTAHGCYGDVRFFVL